MRAVWKFPFEVKDYFVIAMPVGATFCLRHIPPDTGEFALKLHRASSTLSLGQPTLCRPPILFRPAGP
jgi:hypothetical protein